MPQYFLYQLSYVSVKVRIIIFYVELKLLCCSSFPITTLIFLWRHKSFSGEGPAGAKRVCRHVSAVVRVCEHAYVCVQDTGVLFSNSHRAKT